MDLGMELLKTRINKRIIELENDIDFYTLTSYMCDIDDFGYVNIVPKRALYSSWHGDLIELMFDFETKTHQSLMEEIDLAMDSITKSIHQAKITGLLDYRLHELRKWKTELQEWMEME